MTAPTGADIGPAGEPSAIIPAPAAPHVGPGRFVVDAGTRLSVGDPALAAVAARFRADLATYAGVTLPEPGGAEPVAPERCIRLEMGTPAGCGRRTRGRRADGAPPEVERHRLTVTDGGVLVVGVTAEAVQRGLTSLLQAVAVGAGVLRGARIEDEPEWAWRGLSLDVVRWFVPVAEVKRVIDVLALYKLNVLHLHLTDNEGWRLQIDRWPALTDNSPDGFYRQDDLRDLVDYARDRFVTIVPEVDLPGHAAAVLTAYPHLGVLGPADGTTPLRTAYLDPGVDETWAFVDDVLRQLSAISPAPYLHLGGDEAFGMPAADYVAFVDRAIATARRWGKRVVGWQETCRAGVGPDEIIQHWIDIAGLTGGGAAGAPDLPPDVLRALADHFGEAPGDLSRIADKGAGLLLSPTTTFYLDQPHGDASVDPDQEAARTRLGLQLYPPRSLAAMLDWDLDGATVGIAPDAVVGVEAALWGETVESAEDLELLLLPRLAGVAEHGWSPGPPVAWAAHRRRLAAHAVLWERAGWSWFRAASVDWPGEGDRK